ncbi:hypothetical protein ACHAXT_009743 [Thalassiosira profunda]
MSDDQAAALAAAAARAILRSECFFAAGGGFFTFDDLRQVAVSCKAGREGVSGFIRSMPPDVQKLVRRCDQLKYVLLEKAKFRMNIDGAFRRNPDPMYRFSFASLAFDGERFWGDPWTEISPNNAQPSLMGTADKQICAANDGGTKLFVCGGRAACVPSDEWVNYQTNYDYFFTSGVTALYDVATGLWEKLPDMPKPRHSAAVCRLGTKIYIIGGGENSTIALRDVQCFDLSKGEWVESECKDFLHRALLRDPMNPTRGLELQAGRAAAMLDDSTIVVAGGRPVVMGDVQSKKVLALDVASGEWNQLTDLPDCMGPEEGKFKCRGFLLRSESDPTDSSFVFMKGCDWARMLPNGEWELMPDLSGHIRSDILDMDCTGGDETTLKLFTGNQWRTLPPGKCAKDDAWCLSTGTVLKL